MSPPETTSQPGSGDLDGRPGRWGLFFVAIWTLFLIQPLATAWDQRDQLSGWVGMLGTLSFVAAYISVFARRRMSMRSGQPCQPLGRALANLAVLAGLSLVVMLSIGQPGTATAVYLCVVCAMILPNPWAIPAALATAGAFYAAGFVVPGWEPDPGLLLSMLAATVAVWGIQQMLTRNAQLIVANDENRRLAVSEERNRFARDLHDILGHSLTVITVKAELAQRLLDVDPARAKAEVADLERLSRDALFDVRRAVEGYRELTLPGELARARTALAAAEIDADLPNSTEEVPSDRRELRKYQRVRLKPPWLPVPLAGLNDQGHTYTISSSPFPVQPLAAGAVIDVGDRGFNPPHISLPAGAPFTWHFVDGLHNVRLASGPRLVGTQSRHGGRSEPGVFPAPGHYELFCALHPITMHEVVEVLPAATTAATQNQSGPTAHATADTYDQLW